MGGKKKQAQRTKNNVKPSNSGRTAELMTAKLENIKSFGSSAPPETLPQISKLSLDMLDPNIDPNFHVVLKKMSKKDGVTRHKALTEFVNLCNESEDDVLKSVLPSWIRMYSNLSLDVEHRIREAAQHAHHAIVRKIGRNLAPFIKQIAPFWFISQYDTYAPAASAASNSFKASFPPHKFVDVIVFCQTEILQYISNNLIVETPETISKMENLNKDDVQARYERILISSINGYSLYLSKVPKEHLEKVVDLNMFIISSNKFWKLAKYSNGNVRAAWFSLISSILQFAPNLIDNEHKRVSNVVLNHIDDYDPVVLPNVWEAALLLVTGIKDCWQHINMDKMFMPKFCHILTQGGQGNASFIYPNIILLLSNIPSVILKDKVIFFGKIFSSFQKGLKQTCVTQSHSESEAVAKSFIECIQYLIMIYTNETELCTLLIEQYVLSTISMSMLESTLQHVMAPLYNALAQMLLHWKNNEKSNVSYINYSEIFWKKLAITCRDNINKYVTDGNVLNVLFDSNIKMIDHLSNRKCKRKKSLKVKFSTNENETNENKLHEIEADSMISSNLQLRTNIIETTRELANEYFNIAVNNECYEIKILAIRQLWKITTLFRKEDVIQLFEGNENNFCKALHNWISDANIPTEPLIGVIFAVIDNITDEQIKEGILLELLKVRSKDAIFETAKMANTYVNDTLLKWMKSSIVKNELCDLYKTFAANDISIETLNHCLRSNDSGGFIIGEETVLALIAIVTEQLKSKTPSNHKNLSIILDSFFGNFNSNCIDNYKEILLELLYLCFRAVVIDGKCETLFTVWRKGLDALKIIFQQNDPLLTNHVTLCANFIAESIHDGTEINEQNLSLVIKMCVHFISTIVQQDATKMINMGVDISQLILGLVLNKTIALCQQKLEDLCFHTEVLNGNLYNKDNGKEKNVMSTYKENWDPLKEISFVPYIRSLIFCVKFSLSIVDDTFHEDETENELGSLLECTLPRINISEMNDLVNLSIQLIYGLVLTLTIKRYYNDVKQYFLLGDNINSLERWLKELVQRLNQDQQNSILTLAQQKADQLDKHWSLTQSVIANNFLDSDIQLHSKLLSEDICLEQVDGVNTKYVYSLRRDMLNNQVEDLDLCVILDNLVISYKVQSTSSHCKDLSNCNCDHLMLHTEVARLLTLYIGNFPSEIDKSQKGWDFIMISIASWIKSISLTKTITFYREYVGFVIAVCDLYIKFISHITEFKKDSKMFEEWRDLFLSDTNDLIGDAWEFMASKTLNNNLNYIGLIHLKKLCEVVSTNCQIEEVRYFQMNSKNFDTWISRGRRFITSPYIPVQIAAYKTLINLVPLMVKSDSSCDENDLHKLSCENIKSLFIETQNVVSTMLHCFSLDVSCSVAPFTDSYTYTLGYIFIWSVLLEMCKYGDSQIRYLYTLWIKHMNLISPVMENLLKLMPDSVIHFIESHTKKRQELFTERPSLTFDEWKSEHLSNFCCWLFCDILRTLPAVARQWAAETDPKLLSHADKITTLYVSSALCAEEMKAIMNQQKAFDNMKVTTHPSVREVQAIYTVEESSTELIITLATNHPLTPPKVEIPKAMISSNQTRQWLMQLTIFLTHQNGSIWDGLLLWKSNLDKKFEGIEECYICFSILHNTSHQLPKLSCQTCKKKFHSLCLYKWFTTSNKSTCPICRNHF